MVNDALAAWGFGPHWVDAIIALTVVEALVLVVWQRRRGIGPPVADWLPNLLSGLCLMAALRGALAGEGAVWVLPWLAASGLIHGVDLVRRWR